MLERISCRGGYDYVPQYNVMVPWFLSDEECDDFFKERKRYLINEILKFRNSAVRVDKFFVINTTTCEHGVCDYCYMKRHAKGFSGDYLNKEMLLQCIDGIKQLGGSVYDVKELIVLGGEPSDSVDSLWLLIEYFPRAYVNVVTNGHWLNKSYDKMWDWVLMNNSRIGITVSVDVPGVDVLKGQRNDEVVNSLVELVKKNVRFSLRTTLYEENYKWLEWWYKLCDELGVMIENNVAWVERDNFKYDDNMEDYIRYTIKCLFETGDWCLVYFIRKYVEQLVNYYQSIGQGVCDNRLSITPWGLLNCCKPFGEYRPFEIMKECYDCQYLVVCGVMCWGEGRIFEGSCWYNKLIITQIIRELYGRG